VRRTRRWLRVTVRVSGRVVSARLERRAQPTSSVAGCGKVVSFHSVANGRVRYATPRQSERTTRAVERYQKIADDAGVSLTTLSLAWCASRWYVASSIIGATTLPQLQENVDAFTVQLSNETLAAVDAVHLDCRDPCMDL
jgi:aryl-alcohol dehydrogenase-like predicted oxidoreductase